METMTSDERANDISQAVLECQHRFWLALQRKEVDLFREVLSADFVCRSRGQEDQDRAALIATLTSIPVTTLDVRGEAIQIHFWGAVAVLTGIQVDQMRMVGGPE
jgi:hypothetical protein